MKKFKIFMGASLCAIVLSSTTLLFGGNGNGPQSGAGGNAANNGKGNTAWIYHQHGNGTWSLMEVPVGGIAGHAAHGDVWYNTGCPLSGPETACQ